MLNLNKFLPKHKSIGKLKLVKIGDDKEGKKKLEDISSNRKVSTDVNIFDTSGMIKRDKEI